MHIKIVLNEPEDQGEDIEIKAFPNDLRESLIDVMIL